jgi:hypothetical protein
LHLEVEEDVLESRQDTEILLREDQEYLQERCVAVVPADDWTKLLRLI